MQNEDYFRRKKDRFAFRGERQIRFFRTVAGPGYVAYPAAGQVVYAEMLRDPTFEKTAGATAAFGTATGEHAFLSVSTSGAQIPTEGSIVCAEQIGARWWILGGGGSGSACDTIRFVILDNGVFESLCHVIAVPRGFTLADVYGADPLLLPSSAQITVVDPLGCYFNEPVGSMNGRTGWAKLMQPTSDTILNDTGYFQLEWEVFGVCCNAGGCT
jgi:hypothetical protein